MPNPRCTATVEAARRRRRRVGRTLSPLLLAWALIAVHGLGSVARAEPAKCRAAVVKQAAVYGRATLTALQRCEDAIVAGKRPATTDCATDPDVVQTTSRARATLARTVAAKCGGKDKQCDAGDTGPDTDDPLTALGWEGLSCPAAAGASCVAAIDDCGDVAACVGCASDGPARDVAVAAYDALVLGGTPVDKTLRKCQAAIGKEAAKLFAAVSKLGEACWAKVNAGKNGVVAPCPAGDASGATLAKIAAARERARARLCKACGGKDKRCGTADDLAAAAIGFAPTCPAVSIPGGAACGGAVESLDDLATCATCVAEFHAGCLGALAAPWGGAYPASCAAAAGAAFRALPGSGSASLVDGSFDFTPGIGFHPADATDGVVRTRIAVTFEDDATVAQANAVLESLDGEVLSMLAGVPALLIRIPDPGTLAALDAIVAATDVMPGVDLAARDLVVALDDLPPKFPRSLGQDVADEPGLDLVKHLIAARVPAAWNAAPPLLSSNQNPPTLVVADAFGAGPPASTQFAVRLSDADDFVTLATASPRNHGYLVLGMALARLTGQAPDCLKVSPSVDRRPCAIGLYPSFRPEAGFVDVRLRAVDLGLVKEQRLSLYELEDKILSRVELERSQALAAGFPTGGIVVNTSLGTVATAGEPDEARTLARVWMVRVRRKGLQDAFLHVSAAGNVVAAKRDVVDATTASPFNAAALIDGIPVGNIGNVLVVEDRTVGPYPFLPGALSRDSKRGGHLSAVGTDVWTIAGFNSGTSLAAPQVAALAATLWQIRPGLTVAQLRQRLIDSARPAPDGAPMIDAYAALLAADASLGDSPVRRTILDINQDREFDEDDVFRFFSDWQSANTLAGRLYSRVDLRGARGVEDVAFDLDLDRDTDGATVEVELQGRTVGTATFNEAAIERDEDIVCYYAFTELYDRDPGEEGQTQCCRWLRENGRLPPDTRCLDCPARGRAARSHALEEEPKPLGIWRLSTPNGLTTHLFFFLEDGTVMTTLATSGIWQKTGTWTSTPHEVNGEILYHDVRMDPCPGPLPSVAYVFEGTWSPRPVTDCFGVTSCPDGDGCPAMKGMLSSTNGISTSPPTPVSSQSHPAQGIVLGWEPLPPVLHQCHSGCFEPWWWTGLLACAPIGQHCLEQAAPTCGGYCLPGSTCTDAGGSCTCVTEEP